MIARHPKYKDEIEEIFSSEDNDFCIDAVLLIDKYGVTAIKTISEYGKDAITIGKEYEQEGLKFLDKYQEDGLGALKVLSKYNQRNPEILISDLKDAMDIDSKMSLRLINECGDDGLELVSMREGNLSEEIIEVYLSASRNNDSKTKVMLGLTGEYNERAGKDYSFFKTEDDSIWEHLKAVCGEDYDEIWKVNETYLKEQIAAKKEIFLTNDPNEDYLLPSGEKNFIRRNWIT